MTMLGTAQRSRTPTGMKVAAMSYVKLETVAVGVQPLLPTLTGYNSGRWKVDARRVLEQTLPRAGFNYHIAEVSELRECAAFTVPERNLVVVRQDVFEGLYTEDVFSRSTVIHELSHLVLSHHVTLHRGGTLGVHKFFEDSEWQAKALTAAIMMPIDACKAARSAWDLAQLCGTSVQAATYRIEQLTKRGELAEQRVVGQLFL